MYLLAGAGSGVGLDGDGHQAELGAGRTNWRGRGWRRSRAASSRSAPKHRGLRWQTMMQTYCPPNCGLSLGSNGLRRLRSLVDELAAVGFSESGLLAFGFDLRGRKPLHTPEVDAGVLPLGEDQ